jgi:hypothetical protein
MSRTFETTRPICDTPKPSTTISPLFYRLRQEEKHLNVVTAPETPFFATFVTSLVSTPGLRSPSLVFQNGPSAWKKCPLMRANSDHPREPNPCFSRLKIKIGSDFFPKKSSFGKKSKSRPHHGQATQSPNSQLPTTPPSPPRWPATPDWQSGPSRGGPLRARRRRGWR